MRLHRMLLAACCITLCGVAAGARANVLYSYTGPFFNSISQEPADGFRIEGTYTTAMRITGWFETLEPLPADLQSGDIADRVLAFSFNDGRQTLTYQSPRRFPGGVFEIGTDGSGRIDAWHINQSVLFSHPRVPGEFAGNIQLTSGLLPLTRDFGLLFACLVETLPIGSCGSGTAVDGASVFNGAIGSWSLAATPVPVPGIWPAVVFGFALVVRANRPARVSAAARG